LLGTGTGSFGSPVSFTSADVAVTTSDFNGDGNPDIASVDRWGGQVSIYLGDGTGGFNSALGVDWQRPSIFGEVFGQSLGIASGDLNHDDKSDLIVAATDGYVAVFLGTGTGEFTIPPTTLTAHPAPGLSGHLSIADINTDGHPDIAASVEVFEYGMLTAIFVGDGVGGFAGVDLVASGRGVALGDFTSDGHVDLAGPCVSHADIVLNAGDGMGSFGVGHCFEQHWLYTFVANFFSWYSYNLYPNAGNRQSAATADFDLDGHLDVVIAEPALVTVIKGTGTGQFEHILDIPFVGVHNVAIADVNDDDKPDVVVTHTGGVSVVLNTTESIPGYTFAGFFSPIEMSGANRVWNAANAGRSIPVKWRLTLDAIAVSDPASFEGVYSYLVNCSTGNGDVTAVVQEYTAGASGLQFLGDGRWQFNWKTPKGYAGTCRALQVRFNDGSASPPAYFDFK
jgi:hypothetical protein